MASYSAALEVALGDQTGSARLIPDAIPNPPEQVDGVTNEGGEPTDVVAAEVETAFGIPAPAFLADHAAVLELAHGEEFFERVYVLPRSIDLGIVLSTVVTTIDVFNAYRLEPRLWLDYDDSAAGEGVELTDLPSLPALVPRLGGAGYSLEVTTEGPPFVDAIITFDFDGVPGTAEVSITFQRSVIFPFWPEAPIDEDLEWVTAIRVAANGFEQRASLRQVPRATIRLEVITEGHERRLLENLIFDGQSRAFGVPVWYRESDLAVAIEVDDLTITVEDTTFLDLQVGGLAIVWQDPTTYEALQIDSFTSTTITFRSPFTQEFPVGSLVMPILAAVLTEDSVEQARWRVSLQSNVFEFVVLDNGPGLADASAFNTYQPTNGTERVLLDDDNFVQGEQVREEWRKLIAVVDNETSFPEVFTEQGPSREGSQKGFFTRTRQELEDVRGLLHALAGRRTSFYLPSFFGDLEVLVDVTSSDQAITVRDVDYVNLVRQRQPRNVIRLVKTDGTKSDPKLVTGSSKPSPGQELISFAPDNIGVNATTAEIERVEYVKKNRIDVDRIRIRHFNSAGKAAIVFPVVAVLEGDA